uniref:Integrase core domain containing protein n=1 Tax=Solanum tuberosum TaxID=4113 RepID=M1DIG3_SOLTU
MELASLRADVAALLTPIEPAPEATPTADEDDVVMTTLFGDAMPPPDSSRAFEKRPHSDHTFDTEEGHRSKKKVRQQIEAAQQQSILDEEMRQQRAREISVGPSGIVSTTEGALTTSEGATDGVSRVDPSGFGKPDPPTS